MSRKTQSNHQYNADLLMAYASLSDDIRETLKKAIEQTSSKHEEQFLAEVMTGNCR
jgi:hypothetical protein